MIFLFVILPILLVVSLLSFVARILFGAFGFQSRQSRGSWINGTGYGRGFRRHRHHGFGGSILPLLAFVALERLFTRRY